MPPALTLTRALTSWRVDVPTVAVVVPLAAGYLWAARRVHPPTRRTVAFVAALAMSVLVTCSFLGVYDRTLFWVRAVQNVVLLMGVPLLLAVATPVRLTLAAVSAPTAARLRRFGRSAPARALAFPLTVTVALLAPLPVLYLTGLYRLTLDQPAVDAAVRLGLVVAGFGYYWTRLGVDPTPGAGTHLGSFALSMAENLVDGLLGVVVWLGPLIAGDHYLGLHRGWGPSVRADQTAGAVALWFGGDLIGLVYLVVLFGAWSRSDARAARRVDAELDARARTGPSDVSAAAPPTMQDGLWWETDDRFADRFGHAPEQRPSGD